MHFKQLKPFNRASDEGEGWIAVETEPTEVLRPSSTQPGSDPVVIALEDDISPAVVEASCEDPVLVQHALQPEDLIRSQRERRPPFWTGDYQIHTYMLKCVKCYDKLFLTFFSLRTYCSLRRS